MSALDILQLVAVRLGQQPGHQQRRQVEVGHPVTGEIELVRLQVAVRFGDRVPFDVERHHDPRQGERRVDQRVRRFDRLGGDGVGEHRHAHRAVGGVDQVLAGLVVAVLDVAERRLAGQGAQGGLPGGHRRCRQFAADELLGLGADRAAGPHRVELQGDGDPVGPGLGGERGGHHAGQSSTLPGSPPPGCSSGRRPTSTAGWSVPPPAVGWMSLAAAQARRLQPGVDLEELLARPVRVGAGEVDLVGGGEAEVRIQPEGLRGVNGLML